LVANIYHNFREKEKSSGIRVIGPLQGHLWDTIKIQNSSGPLLTFSDPFVKDRAFSEAVALVQRTLQSDAGVSVSEFSRLTAQRAMRQPAKPFCRLNSGTETPASERS
jgi:hypothetical protein